MKQLQTILTIVALLLFAACSSRTSAPETTIFDNYGISFTCPAGWEVKGVEDMELIQTITIEKRGFSSSGIVTIVVGDREIFDVEDFIDTFQETLAVQKMFSNLEISDLFETTYGNYEGLSYTYTMSAMKLPHEGRVYVFSSGGKLVYLGEQEALEDHKKNAAGFETIKESFLIK